MVKYNLKGNGIDFEIDFTIQQNFLVIQGKTNINNLTYSSILSLNDLRNKTLFQKSKSLKKALEKIIILFDNKKGFIKEINNSGIILGIINDQNNEDILFNLIKQPNNNINPNSSSINNISSSMTNSNPMLKANKNIQLNEIAS